MHRRVSESFLKSVANVISTSGVDLGHAKFILSGDVECEIGDEGAVDVEFEDDYEEDGWDGGNPV